MQTPGMRGSPTPSPSLPYCLAAALTATLRSWTCQPIAWDSRCGLGVGGWVGSAGGGGGQGGDSSWGRGPPGKAQIRTAQGQYRYAPVVWCGVVCAGLPGAVPRPGGRPVLGLGPHLPGSLRHGADRLGGGAAGQGRGLGAAARCVASPPWLVHTCKCAHLSVDLSVNSLRGLGGVGWGGGEGRGGELYNRMPVARVVG